MSYIGSTPTSQNFISGTDYFNGTGSQTVFTLTRSVNSVNDVEVVINNVIQQPNSYTVSGTALTLSAAPSAGTSNVYVRYLATNQQSFTVGNNTVGYNQLTADMQSKFAMKNRIINGAMVIDQRNAGASVTVTGSNYSVDRWVAYASVTSKFTVQQNAGSVTPPAGFSNYLGATSSSAYTVGASEYYSINQAIEGFNTSDLGWGTANAKTVTLSAWVYSSLTGTFGGAIQNYARNRSYPFSYSISVANTWTQISVTIAGDTAGTWVGSSNAGSMYIIFSVGTGSTISGTAGSWSGSNYQSATGATSVVGTNGATFYITGVQLEVGTSATGFEYRQYQQELALCQRYYQKFQGVGLDDNWFSGLAYTATSGICPFIWSPQLRASATVSSSGTFEAVGSSVINSATLVFSDSTPFSTQVAAITSSLTAGGGCLVRTASGAASISVSAEL